MTQLVLAERAGLSTRSIQHLEAGTGQPNAETLRRLADALELTSDERGTFEAAGKPAPRRPHADHADAFLPAENPASASLPVPLTSFIGHEQDLDQVEQLLSSQRLVTLLGAGGLGKTRLALVVAARFASRSSTPVTFIDLAPLRNGSLVGQSLLAALGLDEQGDRPAIERIATYLGGRAYLLVMDNCEHVAEESAEVVYGVLRACAGTRVLATSREVLGVPGELVWRVRPLTTPRRGATSLPLDDLARIESVRLFVDRAKLVRQDFTLDETNAEPLTHICQRLDGIPLALELAAARLSLLPLRQIAVGMDAQIRLLSGGGRLTVSRQQTLRTTFDWSYGLLTLEEQAFFRRLSVFAGGYTLEAAEFVGAEAGPQPVLNRLAALVDKSLVLAATYGDQPRYRMLEPVREYAAEQLAAAGETSASRRRHRDYYVRFAEQARRELFGSDQSIRFEQLEAERDNLRAALESSRDEVDGADAELRLAASLGPFWFFAGPAGEGRDWLAHAIARSAREPNALLTGALIWAAQLANFSGDPQAGLRFGESAVGAARELGDAPLLARALESVGFALGELGGNGAVRVLTEAVQVARRTGNARRIGNAMHSLARVTEDSGETRAAERLYHEALGQLRGAGEQWRCFEVMFDLGRLASAAGNYDAALAYFKESLEGVRPRGWRMSTTGIFAYLSDVEQRKRNTAVAQRYACESLEWSLKAGARVAMAAAIVVAARLLAQQDELVLATRIRAAVSTWRTQGSVSTLGGPLRWVVPALSDYDAELERLRRSLGDEVFSRAWREGSGLSLESAVAAAQTWFCNPQLEQM